MAGACCGGSDEEDGPSRPPPQPFSRRNVCCTDIIFLIIFVVFWAFMVYMAVYSVMRGDALRLVFGYDSFGNTCNEDNRHRPIDNLTLSGRDATQLPNVFFFDVFDPFDSMQVCVSQCPDRDLMDPEDVQNFAVRTGSRLCRYDIEVEDYLSQQYDKTGPCPELPIFVSVSLLQRCAPNPIFTASNDMDSQRKDVSASFYQVFGLDNLFRKILTDFYMSWREIIALCVIAVVLAFVMVLLMRFLASFIVWIIVVFSALGSIAGTAFLWWTYYEAKQAQDEDDSLELPLLGIEIGNKNAFLVFSIIATVLTVILLLILLVMRKRISLVVALFHEAGRALAGMPLLLIQPVWTFLLLAAFLVYWVIILAYIATAGYPVARDDTGFLRVEYVLEPVASHFWWVHLIGLIWTAEFILACQQFVIAGTTALWYFTRDKKSLSCPIGQTVSRLLLHHLGSIALGSFVIVLVKIPRYILMYIHTKFEGSDNRCAKCCLKCCICCLWCLEKVLKFLNQNAYTIIAIDGRSFCPAAKKAFSILTTNALRVAALNSVGCFVLFLGKIGVMAATCAIAIVWLRSIGLHLYAVPVFVICVFAFLIAHCLLSVYEMVIDALLVCFCVDSDMNDGVSPGKDYFMSASLMEFVKTSSGNMERLKGRSRKEDENDGRTEEERELTDVRT